jgi:hypothetical protein
MGVPGKTYARSILVGVSTPLKNMKVSWDHDIPNIWKQKIHVPNHQAVVI